MLKLSILSVNDRFGNVLSIRSTVAVSSQVFQTRSTNSKVKDQFQVKLYNQDQLLFVIVIPVSENHVRVTKTSLLVNHVSE